MAERTGFPLFAMMTGKFYPNFVKLCDALTKKRERAFGSDEAYPAKVMQRLDQDRGRRKSVSTGFRRLHKLGYIDIDRTGKMGQRLRSIEELIVSEPFRKDSFLTRTNELSTGNAGFIWRLPSLSQKGCPFG